MDADISVATAPGGDIVTRYERRRGLDYRATVVIASLMIWLGT
jgi:hypothetical protein